MGRRKIKVLLVAAKGAPPILTYAKPKAYARMNILIRSHCWDILSALSIADSMAIYFSI